MALDSKSLIWDYLVFAVFLLGSTFLPLWTKKKNPTSKADYVFASSSGVSMAAMMLSIARGVLGVRSFLGFPSELYYRGSAMWETLYGMICAYPIVSFIFVPVYYSLGITSVYQYLDLRFKSRLVRCLASATFIWRQLLNLGVTVFTPCVALNTVIGLPYWASICAIVSISVLFTLFGGLKAAIKADVIQGLTMILIAMIIIIEGCVRVGSVTEVVDINLNDGRLNFLDFKWDPTVRVDTLSAWIGQMFMAISMFGCQQNFVQRYCSMSSEMKVRKTLLYNIPVIVVLFSLSWVVGMVIYSIYHLCDPLTAGYTRKMDEILPFYVEDRLRFLPGLLGLFMASLFNGALSLLVSNLNSLATVTWEDFVSQAPAFKDLKDKQQLNIIKLIGAIYGVIIMGLAFAVGFLSGVIECSMLVTSATSGPLLGVFILAMLVPCANKKGAAAGMILSHIASSWMAVGHLMYGMKKTELLPLSVDGCTNDTFSSHITKSISQWPQSAAPKAINVTTMLIEHFHVSEDDSGSEGYSPFLYSITYMYYALIGTIICVFVGIIVSLLCGNDESDIYHEKLIHPFILKLSRSLPGKPRTYLTDDKINVKDIKENVNLGFENELKSDISFEADVLEKKEVMTCEVYTSISDRHFENYDTRMRNSNNRTTKLPVIVKDEHSVQYEVTRF